MKKTMLMAAASLAAMAAAPATAQGETLLLRDPAISESRIAFVYAGDLWVADRSGANPRRLTSSPAEEVNPVFSPDGSMIAFTANHEDNRDVYVIPVAGGQPTRLTWHPGDDTVLDWSPDGSEVAFASARETNHGRSAQLFHVSVRGGLPEKQMEARVVRGQYDASGRRFAYYSIAPGYNGLLGGNSGWRLYRGGATPSITVMNLGESSTTEIPGERVNDIEPMWVGDQLYFLSDRDNVALNVYRFDPASGSVEKVSNETVWDIRAADAHGDTIVYEAGGRLKTLDTASGNVSELRISINPDLPQVRPQWKDASRTIETFDLSPSGKRVALTARGEVFTVPVKDGSTRNLTNSDGEREYTALWSPDGRRVAYVDASTATQRLVIEDQSGLGEPRRFDLGPDFYTLIDWGGNGKRIVYYGHRFELYAIDVDTGARTRISERVVSSARREVGQADTSPDGRWVAYVEEQANFYRQLKLFDFTTGRSYPVGDALADASAPAFSRDGKYLYFAASTNSGPGMVFLDMSTQERPYRAGLYAAVLASNGESPVKPASGDEGAAPAADDDDAPAGPTRIDVEGISGRIVALPAPERNYSQLSVAKNGDLFYLDNVQPGASVTATPPQLTAENALMRFDFKEKKAKEVMTGVIAAKLSADGEHVIVQKSDQSLHVGEVGDPFKVEPLKLDGVRMMIDPRAEWNQIFDEVWRMEKAFFYDPNMHGLDWQAIYNRYKPLVAHVGRREDLTALIVEMIGEMQVGHNRSAGGDIYRPDRAGVGLLGADFVLENGRTRIRRLYTGESWNPFIKAPLAAPGLNIREGDYILAVNGRALGATDNIFEFLQGTAGKQVTLRVGRSADGRDARNVVVEPTDTENQLRLWAWVEGNRRAVAAATNGRVGYVFLPNTGAGGYTFFNRMYYAQIDKDAMILDERSNGGGQAANHITDVLSATYLSGWKGYEGGVFTTPGGAMWGPKVMLIDQDAGSGGDFLPYSFRYKKIGPLIGTRTWGGLIGVSLAPPLIDGGNLSVPYFRYFDTNGEWSIENEGVAPDIEVALDPLATNAGRDTQLERAIAEIRSMLAANPAPRRDAPPLPTRVGD